MNSSSYPFSQIPPSNSKKNSLLKKQIFSIPKAKKLFSQALYKNYDFTIPHITNFLIYHSKISKSLTWHLDSCSVGANPSQQIQKAQKIIQILHNQASLSKLDLIFDSQKTLQATLLMSQIKHLSSLEILELQFHGKLLRDFKAFTDNLFYLKKLTTLNITFCYVDLLDSKLFQQFLRSLKVLKNLTNLSLSFILPKKCKDKDLDLLRSHICKLTQLHSLKLHFSYPSQITNQSIHALASALPKICSLKKIEILFVGVEWMKSSTIFQFFSSFSALKSLADITLDLRDCKTDNDTKTNPFSEGTRFLKPSQIQKLSIDFTKDFDAPAFESLTQNISKFSSLVSLSYHFCSCNLLTAESINQSLSQLQILSNLSSLSLKFSSMEMLSSVVGSVAPALKALRALENLTLDFSNLPHVQDKEMIVLSESLTHLTSLKYLDLNLSELELTCKDLESLALSLKTLSSLKGLTLNFGCTNLIGNKIAEALAGAIRSLKNLAFLSLEFDENDTMNKSGLDQLAKAIEGLSGLVKIYLSFFLCPQFNKSDQMLKGLFRALRSSKSIQEITLVLPRSEFIVNEVQQISKRKIIKSCLF